MNEARYEQLRAGGYRPFETKAELARFIEQQPLGVGSKRHELLTRLSLTNPALMPDPDFDHAEAHR